MARGVTLSEMLEMLREEIGHAPSVSLGRQAAPGLKRLLRRTQEFLWNDWYWKFLEVHRDVNLSAGLRHYAFPDDLDGLRVQQMEVQHNSKWCPVAHGITTEQYNVHDPEADERFDPVRRWDWKKNVDEDSETSSGLMFEVWPIPLTSYASATRDGRVRLTGIRKLRTFIADADKCDLDAELIVIYAAGKRLGRQKLADGTEAVEAAKAMYARMKGQGVKAGERTVMGGGVDTAASVQSVVRRNLYSSGP